MEYLKNGKVLSLSGAAARTGNLQKKIRRKIYKKVECGGYKEIQQNQSNEKQEKLDSTI